MKSVQVGKIELVTNCDRFYCSAIMLPMPEMPLQKNKIFIPVEAVSQRIFMIRGQKVMLDMDLAEFYAVTTGNLNLSVRRNLERFPIDFMFQLSKEEYQNLILQIARPSWGGSRHLPYVFTEQGVAMLSSILKSKRAIQTNILIIRAFIRIREILASNKELSYKIEELEREQKLQNKHINAIYTISREILGRTSKAERTYGFYS